MNHDYSPCTWAQEITLADDGRRLMSDRCKQSRVRVTGRSGRIRVGAVLLTLTVLAVSGVFVRLFFIYTLGSAGPRQPIAFSHRLHAGVKAIDCRFCHPYAGRSTSAGIPSVEKCLFCHNYIIPEHPEILKEHQYYDNGVPVPWKRLFVALDFVQFRHQPHIRKGFDCTECHGDVKKMDRLPYHQFEMGFCIGCHRKENGNLSCWLGCHN